MGVFRAGVVGGVATSTLEHGEGSLCPPSAAWNLPFPPPRTSHSEVLNPLPSTTTLQGLAFAEAQATAVHQYLAEVDSPSFQPGEHAADLVSVFVC